MRNCRAVTGGVRRLSRIGVVPPSMLQPSRVEVHPPRGGHHLGCRAGELAAYHVAVGRRVQKLFGVAHLVRGDPTQAITPTIRSNS